MQTNAEAIYLDSSAIVKLIIREPESADLRVWLAPHSWRLSCELARVEVPRAVRLSRPRSIGAVPDVLDDIDLMPLTADILLDAARLDPPRLRSPDAIHLAAARTLGAGLGQIVTYDRRMAQAAEMLGLPTIAPGQQG